MDVISRDSNKSPYQRLVVSTTTTDIAKLMETQDRIVNLSEVSYTFPRSEQSGENEEDVFAQLIEPSME